MGIQAVSSSQYQKKTPRSNTARAEAAWHHAQPKRAGTAAAVYAYRKCAHAAAFTRRWPPSSCPPRCRLSHRAWTRRGRPAPPRPRCAVG
eukprot:363488-Chlamydomonas_euryale.AAC.10